MDRATLRDLIARYGREAVSFQAMKSWSQTFVSARVQGAVAYFDTGRAWVAVGSPLAAEQHVPIVAEEFVRAGACAGRFCLFFGVESKGLELLARPSIQMGLQPVFQLTQWLESRSSSGEVGRQTRRAIRKGVTARHLSGSELGEREELGPLLRDWRERKSMATMGFLVELDFLRNRRDREFFGAFQNERLVAILAASPSPGGWFWENLIVGVDAPNGTGELLLVQACRWAQIQQARQATLGLTPLAHLDTLEEFDPNRGRRKGLIDHLLLFCYRRLNWLYSFQGLARFKKKFRPTSWEPVYLVVPDGSIMVGLLHLLRAFAGGSLTQFATATTGHWLRRTVPAQLWSGLPRFLAVALLFWIGVLGAGDSYYWFGNAWLGKAWVGFDILVVGIFWLLAHGVDRRSGWTGTLAGFSIGLISADVWLTWSQAFLYNLPRGPGFFELLVILAAMIAPFFALLYLVMLVAARPYRSNL